MGESGSNQASSLRDYIQIARRRRGIILTAVVLVPLTAMFLSLRQEKLYEASAQVYVDQQNIANALTEVAVFDVYQSADRVLQTQADIANAPEVWRRVWRTLGSRSNPNVEVVPKIDSNFLRFSSVATSPRLAGRMASEFAEQYKQYKSELETKAVARALAGLNVRIDELRREGPGRDPELYASLIDQREQLRTAEALQTSRVEVFPASRGSQIQPKPVRNTAFGLVLGIFLGLGVALLREALDTRVRSTDEIAERLGLPLLARLPEPPRRVRRDDGLVMIDDPDGPDAEAFRILRTNLDFVRLDKDARTLMVTSAVEAEGKSTTAANLAVALARVGLRVALVDLDLRRPFLHKFFGLEGPGMTHVAVGYATLEEALVPIPLDGPRRGSWNGNGDGLRSTEGMLEVLPAGPMPPNVDEFLAGQAVADVLGELRKRADIVLIDSTPLLVVGDAIALTAAVDALVVVTRMNVVRRPMLRELRRVLEATPTNRLGFIATGADRSESHYGYIGYHYRAQARAREPVA